MWCGPKQGLLKRKLGKADKIGYVTNSRYAKCLQTQMNNFSVQNFFQLSFF